MRLYMTNKEFDALEIVLTDESQKKGPIDALQQYKTADGAYWRSSHYIEASSVTVRAKADLIVDIDCYCERAEKQHEQAYEDALHPRDQHPNNIHIVAKDERSDWEICDFEGEQAVFRHQIKDLVRDIIRKEAPLPLEGGSVFIWWWRISRSSLQQDIQVLKMTRVVKLRRLRPFRGEMSKSIRTWIDERDLD